VVNVIANRFGLTAEEMRIVGLLAQGYKDEEIASKLGTTEQSMKDFLRNVYDKTGVSDRRQLALLVLRHGGESRR
jgi:DNA-binding NarL/FixJ family response regulator